MIAEAQLSWMRATVERSMPDTCSISTPGTETRDAYGETVPGSPTVRTNIICGYSPATGNERVIGGAVVAIGDYIVRLPANTVVRADSTITVAARDDAPAHVFQVKAALHGSDEVVTRVLATEV